MMRLNGHSIRGSCYEKSWGPRNGHVAWMCSVTYHLVLRKSFKFYSLFGCRSAAQSFRPPYFLLCPPIWIEAKVLSCARCCYDQKIGPGAARTPGVHRSPLLFMLDWWGGNGCCWYYHHCESSSSPNNNSYFCVGWIFRYFDIEYIIYSYFRWGENVLSTFRVWGHGTLARLSTSGQVAVHRSLGVGGLSFLAVSAK